MPRRRAESRAKKQPIDVEALWAIKRVGAPTLSPDGRTACAPVTSYDMEKNEGTTELWLFPTDWGAKSADTCCNAWTGSADAAACAGISAAIKLVTIPSPDAPIKSSGVVAGSALSCA